MNKALDDTVPDDYDAFDIINELAFGLDFVADAPNRNWRIYLTQHAYETIKNDPEGYVYKEGDEEYIIVYDNAPHFVIHMRVAGIDNSISESDPDSLGCRCEIDSV